MDVDIAAENYWVAGVGVDMQGLVAVVMVVVRAANGEEGVASVDVEGDGGVDIVGHDDDGAVAGGDETGFDRSVAVHHTLVAPEVADVLTVRYESGEVIGTGGSGDGVQHAFVGAVGYPPTCSVGGVNPGECGGGTGDR